jgi:hypothetical protein
MQTLFLTVSLLFSFCILNAQKVSIQARPETVWIEVGETRQIVNFDFLVTHHGSDTLTLTKLMISVMDNQNSMIHSKFLDNNGVAPAIRTIPNREFAGKTSQLIFNPFTDFSTTLPISKLVFEWTFMNNAREEFQFTSTISPRPYHQMERYKFPLKGRVLVYDGHELFTHHRRFDYEFAPIKSLGISANFMRYAFDFVLVDNNNKQYINDGSKTEDYLGFSKAVYAIGSGKVIYASNVHHDDKTFDIPNIAKNPLELYGNCVAIQHADQSISIYGHLKENSIIVKTGDQVKEAQEIAAIGVSGSSFFPHLHFEIRTSLLNSAEGLPVYFSNINLLEGSKTYQLKSGLVETGSIIETR